MAAKRLSHQCQISTNTWTGQTNSSWPHLHMCYNIVIRKHSWCICGANWWEMQNTKKWWGRIWVNWQVSYTGKVRLTEQNQMWSVYVCVYTYTCVRMSLISHSLCQSLRRGMQDSCEIEEWRASSHNHQPCHSAREHDWTGEVPQRLKEQLG